MEIADELQIDQANNANIVPVVPPSPIYLVVEEVPMDQLVGSDDEEPPVHDENPPQQTAEENQDGI